MNVPPNSRHNVQVHVELAKTLWYVDDARWKRRVMRGLASRVNRDPGRKLDF